VAPDPRSAASHPGAGSIRSVARSILRQPQFRQPPESPLDRLRHWLAQRIGDALAAAFSGRVTVVGMIVLAGIVALIIWGVVRTSRRVGFDRSFGGVVVGASSRPPGDWLREAAACEQRGDWRGALRARYRALVSELARKGLVADAAGRTTGEYRREVTASLPSGAAAFGGATDLFELAVYGDGPTGPEQSSHIQHLADRVLAGAK
jgi:hypothetical protein